MFVLRISEGIGFLCVWSLLWCFYCRASPFLFLFNSGVICWVYYVIPSSRMFDCLNDRCCILVEIFPQLHWGSFISFIYLFIFRTRIGRRRLHGALYFVSFITKSELWVNPFSFKPQRKKKRLNKDVKCNKIWFQVWKLVFNLIYPRKKAEEVRKKKATMVQLDRNPALHMLILVANSKHKEKNRISARKGRYCKP